jgi:hypothetical protein
LENRAVNILVVERHSAEVTASSLLQQYFVGFLYVDGSDQLKQLHQIAYAVKMLPTDKETKYDTANTVSEAEILRVSEVPYYKISDVIIL